VENIILIGHGSPKKDANNIELAGRLLHNAIHPNCAANCVKVAYLQFAEPEIADTIKKCVEEGAKKIIIHPYFLSSGMHVTKDIPEIIKEAERQYPDREFIYTEPLGIHEKLVQVVVERIHAANGGDCPRFTDGAKRSRRIGTVPVCRRRHLLPDEIEKKSFEIIAEETDLSGFPPEQVPIIKRVIHATADFEFKNTLMFHPDAIAAGINAIKSGKDILTDVEMVKAGINKKLLKKWGGKVICHIQKTDNPPNPPLEKGGEGGFKKSGGDCPGFTDGAKWSPRTCHCERSEAISTAVRGRLRIGTVPVERETKAEMGIESALKENNNIGIIAIGNAPTALLKVIEIFTPPTPPLNKGGLGGWVPHSPILVIGVPVGFVKAFESKALLSAQKFPFITNLSRKGGSPVAAAIVNALLKMAC